VPRPQLSHLQGQLWQRNFQLLNFESLPTQVRRSPVFPRRIGNSVSVGGRSLTGSSWSLTRRAARPSPTADFGHTEPRGGALLCLPRLPRLTCFLKSRTLRPRAEQGRLCREIPATGSDVTHRQTSVFSGHRSATKYLDTSRVSLGNVRREL